MKKSGILNGKLARIVASMGHTDQLVICDSGLPIPSDRELVDLALAENIPRFLDTLRVVLDELSVEKVIVADEMESCSSRLLAEVRDLLPEVELDTVPHRRFKEITREEAGIRFVRTGEATPYANIILVSGVTF